MADTEFYQAIGEFLLGRMSRDVRAAYEALSSLDYPVTSRLELTRQLENNESLSKGDVPWLVEAFQPEDFGLDTLQNALEKLHHRTSSVGMRYRDVDARLRVLSAALGAGRIAIEDGYVVMKPKDDGGGVNVKCTCGGTKGACVPAIDGNSLYCETKTGNVCTGSCSMVISVPTVALASQFVLT